MFEHWTMLRKAKKALQEGSYEEAYELTLDPLVRDHLRARMLRSRALKKLLDRAKRHHDRNNLSAAYRDVRFVLSGGERTASAVAMERDLRESLDTRDEMSRLEEEILAEAQREFDAGLLVEARSRLRPHADRNPRLAGLLERIDARLAEAQAQVKAARKWLAEGAIREAEEAVSRAAERNPALADLDELRAECLRVQRERMLADIAARFKKGDVSGAWSLVSESCEENPDWMQERVVSRVARAMVRKLLDEARGGFREGTPESVLLQLDKLGDIGVEVPEAGEMSRTARVWRRGLELLGRGEPEISEGLLAASLEREPGSPAVRRDEERARALRVRVQTALDDALTALSRGDIGGGRQVLDPLAREFPDHRFLEAFLEGMSAGEQGRIVPIEEIDRLMEEGSLTQALARAVALFCTAPLRKDAERIVREVEKRRLAVARALVDLEKTCLGGDLARADLEGCLRRVAAARQLDRDARVATEIQRRVDTEITVQDRIEWGEAHERKGEWEEALKWYREGLGLSPGHSGCERKIQAATERLARERGEEVERLFEAGRWEESRQQARRLLRLGNLPARMRARASEIDRRVSASEKEAAKLETCASEHLDEGRTAEARAALGRLFRVFPGHPGGVRLRQQIERFESVRDEIEEIEGLLDARKVREASRLMESLKELPEGLPRVRALEERIGREITFQDRFVIRVEEGSDYLVLMRDRVRIGNIMGKELDLSIMANISREHAQIERTASFHGGMRYELRALPGKECSVNGKRVSSAVLHDGDRIRLGENFEIEFRMPTSKSKSAVLILAEGFDVDGINKILLMVPSGREGRIVIAHSPDSHVSSHHADKEIEIFRAAQGSHRGELVCRSNLGVTVDEEGGRAEERIYPGCLIQCGNCRITIDSAV